MAVKPIPNGYHSVTPYIVVKDVRGLIAFLKQAFDAKDRSVNEGPGGTIMHAEVGIGDSVLMMGESSGEFQPMPAMIHLYVEDTDAVYRSAIAAGGESMREPADQFYGDRSGGIKDSWGNQWWIATHVEDVSPEEMERRMKASASA